MEYYLPVETRWGFWAIQYSEDVLDQQYRYYITNIIVIMIMHTDHLIYVQSFGSLITFGGQILFDSNRNHPEGFSGVLHLAAFGQIMLQSGVNMTFTNNTGA